MTVSKAFTKEDSAADDELVVPDLGALPPGVVNYATPRGAELLRDKIEAARAALVAEPTRRAMHEPKLAALLRRLDALEVVDPATQPRDRVLFGATVEVDDDGTMRTYAIVGVDEAEPAAGVISWRSPLAQALLNRRVGDVVTIETPAGERELEILVIR